MEEGGGGGGRVGLQKGEVIRGRSLHLSCKRNQIKMRDYVDRQLTPPKPVTLPTLGPPPPCKQAINKIFSPYLRSTSLNSYRIMPKYELH